MTSGGPLVAPRDPDVVVHADADALVEAVSARLLAQCVTAQASGDTVDLVLTGGRTGIALCDALATMTAALDPTRMRLWFGDERYLPATDCDRNDVQAERLLDALPGARIERVLGPDGSADAAESARDYAERLRGVTHDVLLLSMGPDGHVASLFPEHPALQAEGLVTAVHGSPKPPPTRVSLTLEGIGRAREVWLLASGAEKAAAVRLAMDAHAGVLQAPSVGARGTVRTLLLLDRAAAADLPVGMARPAP